MDNVAINEFLWVCVDHVGHEAEAEISALQ
jgi:hypothetical protein